LFCLGSGVFCASMRMRECARLPPLFCTDVRAAYLPARARGPQRRRLPVSFMICLKTKTCSQRMYAEIDSGSGVPNNTKSTHHTHLVS
jgi:hypothetical protein